jgi:NAD(P)-dependent dehydrogenase (short-subunit alcohol dehydrogenase family)
MKSFSMPFAALVQGASRGIGLEFVRELLGDPSVDAVYATCRSPNDSEGLVSLSQTEPDRLRLVSMDLADEGSVAAAASELSQTGEDLHLLINCAGLLHDPDGMRPERRLSDVRPEQMIRSYQVNTIGPVLVAKHFQKLFAPRGRSVFASLSARVGSIGDNQLGGWYAYRAAKAAQNMITRNLSIELRRSAKDIICVALHPGTVDTDLSRPFQRNVPRDRLFTPERAARQLLAVIDSLTPASNGNFYAWNGTEIPW